MNLNDFISDPKLYQEALTHRSFVNEHSGSHHNERLEFLGDSVLSLVISDRLFRLLPDSPEGELTSRRSHLVQTTTLAKKAILLGLETQLLLSRGEEDSGGRTNTGLLANLFEAVLGAIFVSSGLPKCYEFLSTIFPDSEILSEETAVKDAKSLLQEKSQSQGWGTPLYKTISISGPDHARQFEIQVQVNNEPAGTGMGPSKQKAETQAADAALKSLFS